VNCDEIERVKLENMNDTISIPNPLTNGDYLLYKLEMNNVSNE